MWWVAFFVYSSGLLQTYKSFYPLKCHRKVRIRFFAFLVALAWMFFNILVSTNNFQHSQGVLPACLFIAGFTPDFTRTKFEALVQTVLLDSNGVHISPFLLKCFLVEEESSSLYFCICSYSSSIHEKANCIAIFWTGRPHSLGSCHFF